MTLAMICRADQGGTASQTWEIYRHVQPDKALILTLVDVPRGTPRIERYDLATCEHRVSQHHPIDSETWDWLLEDTDTLFTVEGPYDNRLPAMCARRHVRLIYHANPELWDERYRGTSSEVWLPTDWEQERVDPSEVVPMPVDRTRCKFRQRTRAETFLFPWGPAFHDRNGYDLFRDAADLVSSDVRLVVAGLAPELQHPRLDHLGEVEDYWQLYAQADVLVLPRRYGGLSLCIQEAVSCGMPIVTLDLPPYNSRVHEAGLVPTRGSYPARMRGGRFPVHQANPADLALAIDRLAQDPMLVEEMSRASDHLAAELDWQVHEKDWRERLDR